MKRKGLIVRLAVLAVVLCLVTMSLTAGTLAKYASEVTGTATATVAKWAIAFKDGDGAEFSDSNTLTLNLKDTQKVTDKLVADNRIAPGTTGSFDLQVDGSGTEVAFSYTIELDLSADALKKAPIKFYSSLSPETPLAVDATGKATVSDTVMADGTNTVANQTVYWKWDSTAYDAETNEDIRDTKVGEASAAETNGLVYTIPVTITAEQLLTASSGT